MEYRLIAAPSEEAMSHLTKPKHVTSLTVMEQQFNHTPLQTSSHVLMFNNQQQAVYTCTDSDIRKGNVTGKHVKPHV